MKNKHFAIIAIIVSVIGMFMLTYGIYVVYNNKNNNGIILKQNDMTINVNDSVELEFKKIPENKYVFESSDSSIATVDENGIVTAKRTGQVTITISSGDEKETCLITIVDGSVNNNSNITDSNATNTNINTTPNNNSSNNVIYPNKITFKNSTLTLKVNESYTLNYTVSPNNVTDLSVKWSSSNNKVVSVENGIIRALEVGTSVITITTSNGKKAECKVTVTASKLPTIEVSSIKFVENTLTLTEGSSKQLNYKITPADATNQSVTIKSSNSKVVSVKNGIVTALKAGTSTITVTSSNGKKAECKITVVASTKPPVEVSSISFKESNIKLIVGASKALTYTILPTNATNQSVTIKSSDSKVVSVEKGIIKALKAGTSTITVTSSNGKTATCLVTVENPIPPTIEVTSVKFTESSIKLTVGASKKLNYQITPSNATNQIVRLESSNTNVASIENGIVKALQAGTSTITITSSNGKTATCLVTVENPIPPTIEVTSVKFTSTNINLTVGASKELTYTILPSNATNQSVKISSSNTSIVSVSNKTIKALKVGKATLTITTANGKTATCTVNVTAASSSPVAPTKVTIQAVNSGLKLGSTISLNYSFEPSNATKSLITFVSSNTSVATVDNVGKVTAKSLGETVISAVVNNKTLSSVIVKVIPNLDYIRLDQLRIKEKVKDIKFINPHNNEVIAMQDFDIVNLGRSDETYYFATTYDSLLHNTIKPQGDQVRQLKTGIIYKLTKSQLGDTRKGSVMYVDDAGQCQWIIKEPTGNYFWTSSHSGLVCSGDACVYDATNGYSCTDKSKCTWWGGNNTNVKRINFVRNSYGDSSTGLEYDYGNLGGNKRITVFMAYDGTNDLMAVFTKITSKVDVKVYKASDYINGIKTQLYSFTIPYNDNIPSSSVQGYALSGGYVYRFRGIYTTGIFIEVIDTYGNIILTKEVDPGYRNLRQEAQGIKVYNNKLYFGLNYLSKCTFDQSLNDCKPGTAGENLHGIFYYE